MRGKISKLAVVLTILLSGAGLVANAQEPTPNPDNPQPPPQSSSKTKKPAVTQKEAAPTAPPQIVAEQTDLSGTYAGTFTCDAAGLTGDTTLTITGNQFTTSDGRSGRIVATTTQGYTAVAFQPDGAAGQSSIISLRAKRSGSRLTLTSVDGAAVQCSFVPARNTARTRKTKPEVEAAPAAAATGEQVANPGVVGPSPEDVASPKTARSKSKRAKKAPPAPAAPAAAPVEVPVPAEKPVPVQTPAPIPPQSPTPTPTPTGSPTPEPSPSPGSTPSPTPTPTPTPSPKNKPSA